MAQQVVADVDEIFVDVFGVTNNDDVIGGYGAHVGYVLVKNAEGDIVFRDVLESIVRDVQRAPRAHLDILGLVRLPSADVVHKLNGRLYNGTDGEAAACKLYSAAKVTYGAYSTSSYPFFSKSHCHPMRLHPSDVLDDALESGVRAIMKSIEQAMWECTCPDAADNIRLTIPEFCLRPGERDWRERFHDNSTVHETHT